jgi:hypothetical protein
MDQRQEQTLRNRLGIPTDARHVLIFAESSHWDPDWLFTSDEYFDTSYNNPAKTSQGD